MTRRRTGWRTPNMKLGKVQTQHIKKMINKKMNSLVDKTNADILQMFQGLGMNYIPFQLEYNAYNVRGNYNEDHSPEITPDKEDGRKGDVWKGVKNVRLIIDDKFLDYYFQDRISYDSWLSSHYPRVSSEHWRNTRNNETDTPEYNTIMKEFHAKVPVENRVPTIARGENVKTKSGAISQYNSTIVGYIRENKSSTVEGLKNFKSFSGKDVEKFSENQGFIFKGNIKTFLDHNEDKRVDAVLHKALEEFNRVFESLDLKEVTESVEKTQERQEFNKTQKGFLDEIEELKSTSYIKTPKFPNINNVKNWFMKHGLARSTKLNDFLNIKTVTGRANFIDRSVFLIANGVYAKKLGQRTYRVVDDPDRPVPFKKGMVSGKAATISHARKYKKFSSVATRKKSGGRDKYETDRQIKLAIFKADVRKIAHNYKKSAKDRSVISRKDGRTSRAQRDWRRDTREDIR